MKNDDAVQAQTSPGESTLHIPPSSRPWAEFADCIQSLLADNGTHVYVDTSFLMWLTKIGTPSRTQLFDWLTQAIPDRLHVPIWAAHEYLKHYTKRTVLKDFTTIRKEVQSLARGTYDRLRPFVDEPIGPREHDPATFRADIRKALNTLEELLQAAGGWTSEYERHTTEVLEFINGHTPNATSVYSELENVSTYAHSRLTSAVPPGFKDLWKSRRPLSSTDETSPPPGANTYGDILLWKEILSHAKSVAATGIILITNDFKSDWRMGRQTDEDPKDPELRAIRKSWKPVPRPHPMLLFEARNDARVNSLELIDSVYLGAFLKQLDGSAAPAFIDVALVPDPNKDHKPSSEDPSGPSTKGVPTSPTAELAEEPLFSDPPNVRNSLANLRSALLQSRQPLNPRSLQLLDSWIDQDSEDSPFWRIDADALADVDHTHLTEVARTLHDRALDQQPGSIEALADLVANIERFPPNTAATIYFGLLSSMFLQQPHNQPRIPPKSSVAERLLDLRHEHFARHAVTVLSRHLNRADERPLYVPSSDPLPISITFDTDNDRMPPEQLASMRLDTGEELPAFPVELLTPTETYPRLHLASLFSDLASVNAQALISQAAAIYAFPVDSIEVVASHTGEFVIPDALSFRDPREIRIQQET